jgi:hypothetical protein
MLSASPARRGGGRREARGTSGPQAGDGDRADTADDGRHHAGAKGPELVVRADEDHVDRRDAHRPSADRQTAAIICRPTATVTIWVPSWETMRIAMNDAKPR